MHYCVCVVQVKLESFEAVLSKAREERLAKRKAERQERRRAEAAAIATAEQERLSECTYACSQVANDELFRSPFIQLSSLRAE